MRKLILVLAAAITAIASPTWAAVVPTASQAQVIEFYNATLDHYFITADPKEASDLDTGVHAGWKRTGLAFQGVIAGSTLAGTNPVCRFYGKPEAGLDSHFYTSSSVECEAVKQKFPDQWQFESAEVFRAFAVDPTTGKCPADTEAIYRLWNKRADVNHRYTDQISVFEQMLAKGYTPEGDGNPALPVVFCAPIGASATPVPAAPGTPSCTLAASTTTPVVTASITLTATCTNNPTSFNWIGCTSSTLTCTTTSTVAGSTNYLFTGTNAVGAGNIAQLNVAWQGASGPVPICTLSGTTTTPQTGTNLMLSASCSLAPTRYDWLECSYMLQSACNPIPSCSSTSANCAITTTIAGFAHYALAATNSAGSGPRVGFDVEWKNVGTPAPAIPSCSLTASNGSPTIGSSIVLSTSCSGNPATYTWTGCTSGGAACSTSSATTGPKNYSVVAGNATGNSAPASATVNWVTPPVPSCSVSASKTTPTVGETITMTAACSGSPTGYQWTGCPGNGAVCTAVAANAGAQTYSVIATNATGASPSAAATVNWQAAPTSAPVCTLTSSNSAPFTGTAVTLTASCNNQATSYTWTGCTAASGATCVATGANAGNVTYGVTGKNIIGSGALATVTVNWQQSTAPPDFCSAYHDVLYVTLPWGGFVNTMGSSGFKANGVLVGVLSVPSGAVFNSGSQGQLRSAEYVDPPTDRMATLSLSPCDFGQGGSGVTLATAYGTRPNIVFTVTGTAFGAPQLQPGRTYYFNLRNWSQDLQANTCSGNTCNMQLDVSLPR